MRWFKPGLVLIFSLALLLISLPFSGCMSFSSNGQRVYFTSTSSSDEPIVPEGYYMPMMRIACVNCHGPNGQGGSVNMMGYRYDVPNITWPELSIANEDRPAYTVDSLKLAITEGTEPNGEQLEYPMPVWQISSGDLDDLVGFIQTLN
jgi:cytochrome c oxidase subunit 2